MTRAASGWGAPWPAPAKLNLFLHILGRRDDGYHRLQTAFQFIDLCDTLVFQPRDDGRVERPLGLPGLPPDDDLVVRAARRLQAETGFRGGVDILVQKRIPDGGGLGGGSSDAATALTALNRLWDLRLPGDALARLGQELGADVPVFVGGRAAWAEGVGNRLTPMDFPQAWYVVVHPGCRVGTAEVFAAPELTRNSEPTKIAGFAFSGSRNDCEATVRARYPAVAEALDWLSARGEARLTGTGACAFLRCETEAEARRLAAEVPGPWTGYAVRGLNRSPLLDGPVAA